MFNNSYIKMGRYKRIAHMIFNGSLIHEIADEREYVSKIRKATEINLTNNCDHYVFVGDRFRRSINHLLRTAAEMNFDLAVVWFEGSWPMSKEFETQLLDRYDNVWKDEWLAAGHILHRNKESDQPVFHTQCVAINLKSYAKIGMPPVEGTWQHQQFPAFVSSDEHLHDDYTPTFLAPPTYLQSAAGYGATELNISNNYLDCLIPMALASNMMVHNFDYDIRGEKYCCYPEDNVAETKTWLLDLNWDEQDIDYTSRFGKTVDEDKQELYGFKVMKTHVMYVTNTESVPTRARYDCNVMTAPCSGLHQFKHMCNARDTLERVVWTDFSEAGIWWTQKVLQEWDGRDFKKFFADNEHEIEKRYVAYYACNYDPENVDDFMETFKDEAEWLEYWDWIRTLDHEFLQVDMVKNWERVVAAIGSGNRVFMQISNIWQYETNYFNTPHFQAQASYINLVNELLKNNEEVYFTGDSPSGIFYSYQNMKELISIL